MPVTVLVATPHAAFGELLRVSLLDSGAYQIKMAQTAQAAREAFSAPNSPPFDLAIFDSALAGEPFAGLCRELLAQQPGVRLIVIPPENNPNHASLGGLMPHGYLSRPFYLPDLIETVQRLLLEPGQVSVDQSGMPPEAQKAPATQPAATAMDHEAPTAPAAPVIQAAPADTQMLQHALEQALAKHHALAALVGVTGQAPGKAKIIAQAGSLPEENARALADVAFRYWNNNDKTDLMRYIHIPQDRNDFLVYATRISGDLALVMAHDNTTPVSSIRPQTREIAQMLESALGQAAEPAALPPALPEAVPAVTASEDLRTQPLDDEEFIARLERNRSKLASLNTWQTEIGWSPVDLPQDLDSLTQPAGSPASTAPDAAHEAAHEADNEEELAPQIDLGAMLGEVPSPDPDPNSPVEDPRIERFASREVPTIPGSVEQPLTPEAWRNPVAQTGVQPEAISPHKRQTEPLDPSRLDQAIIAQENKVEPNGGAGVFIYPELAGIPGVEATREQPVRRGQQISAAVDVKTEPPITPTRISSSLEGRPAQVFNFPAEPPPGPEDTQPSVINALTRLDQLEPVSPALSLLKYTCVILPRLPQHYLTGDLADKLAGWVPQACLAYGWRLEAIAIRPDYLQWTVQVAPAVSPGNLVRILRQRISYHIFGAFPHLSEQNPSGDFWATGYLIVSGPQPPSAQLLRDYINQTRKRQGAIK